MTKMMAVIVASLTAAVMGGLVVQEGGSFAEVAEDRPGLQARALPGTASAQAEVPRGTDWFRMLPDGERKRRFLVDCAGCHVFDGSRIQVDGRPRTEEEWRAALQVMVSQFGQGTGFPILSSERDPASDAAWLAQGLGSAPTDPVDYATADLPLGEAEIREYPVPEPGDLAHDLMVHPDGSVLVTGMFTHRMYILDPGTGEWETEPIPVQGANPRALDIAPDGTWWVLLGAPGRVARYRPTTAEWTDFDIGMYGHSVVLDDQGRVWTNGHFTVGPELIVSLDSESGELTRYEVPAVAMATGGESTIPYGLRVAPDGTVWGTQLRGSHLIRLDPETGEVDLWETPTSYSGPRRPDVAPDGTVWIPEFGAGKLARFDPETERFTEYDLPIPDALPYVVRVNPNTGLVWIGTGAADAMLSFDPRTERFTVYPLPTRGTLIRHIDIDPETGDVWGAYSASPGIPGEVFRLRVR